MASKKITLVLFIIFFVSIASISFAQSGGYIPLAPIDGVSTKGEVVDINNFIPNAIRLGIGIAGVLSVIYIMIGGLKYIVTDVAQVKTDAKDTIQNAIIGLLLAIGSYAILYTIDDRLVKFQINIQGVRQGKELPTTISFGTTSRTAEETGCVSNCVSLSGTGLTLKGGGSLACSNNPCYLNSSLIDRLDSLKTSTNALSIGWQITEAFPPTVPHADSCHKAGRLAGSCVDIALTGDTSVVAVINFMIEIEKEFDTFIYEKCPTDSLTSSRNPLLTTALRSKIKCTDNTIGQHAHIEL